VCTTFDGAAGGDNFNLVLTDIIIKRTVCSTQMLALRCKPMTKMTWSQENSFNISIFILADDITPAHQNIAIRSECVRKVHVNLNPDAELR